MKNRLMCVRPEWASRHFPWQRVSPKKAAKLGDRPNAWGAIKEGNSEGYHPCDYRRAAHAPRLRARLWVLGYNHL